MSTDPSEAIRQRIRTDGPITFATYMELALYGPGGYYEEPPVGADGDFVTSPHVHPAFGMFVARALKTLADDLGSPEPLRVTEVGAGDGTLAGQILTRARRRLHGGGDQRRRAARARRDRRARGAPSG